MWCVLPLIGLLLDQRPTTPNHQSVTGGYQRKVTVSKPGVQEIFDEGIGLLYAFHKEASGKKFAEATKADSTFAMAWWGRAMALGPDINFPAMDAESSKRAIQFLSKASSLARSSVERALIAAAQKRFDPTGPADRASLDRDYSNSLRELFKQFPNDPDLASLYAESIMILSPWSYYNADLTPKGGTIEAVSALEQALKVSPKHLMANHMMIHAVEASAHPEKGLTAANTLATMGLSLGHLVHMPSHIYVRTGLWDAAIRSNELAIGKDVRFFKKAPTPGTYLPYMVHNRMMLAYAACMNGSYKKAHGAMKDFFAMIPADMMKDLAPMIDGGLGTPLDVERRFGQWQNILTAPQPPEFLKITRANRYANRAIAYAATGMPDKADAEYEFFLRASRRVDEKAMVGQTPASKILDLEKKLVQGELLVLRGDLEPGLASLRQAVEVEDQLTYDEPPDWIQPVRHTLGAALLKANQPNEAIAVYSEDLRRNPNNGWSLLGLSQAYERIADKPLAMKYRKAYEAVWSKEDELVSSSCKCLPNTRH